MLKRVVANALAKNNPGVVANVDCSQFFSCGSCIAQEGCGYCGSIGRCVSGGWFGALDRSSCGLGDYYYHQCHMSTLPLGIISIVLISVVLLAVIVGISILCCCICCKCCQEQDVDEDEDRPLLGSNYLRRSSTYYQWNRQPPTAATKVKNSGDKKNTQQQNTTSDVADDLLPESVPERNESESSTKKWEDRRQALLKKYARESPTTEE
ncbi:unnamed protein product [Mucor hiemalis]